MYDEILKRKRLAAAEALNAATAIRDKHKAGDEWPAEDEEAFQRCMGQFKEAHAEVERLEARIAQEKALSEASERYLTPAGDGPARGPATSPEDQRRERLQRHREAMRRYIVEGQSALTPQERQALISSQGDLGGFNVPDDFVPELMKDLQGFSVIRPRARVRRTSRDALVFPAFAGGTDPEHTDYDVDDEWVTEASLVSAVTSRTTQDKPTFERLRVPVHIWSPKPIVLSHNLLQDNAVNLEQEIRTVIAETRALREDRAFILGDGVNKPKGILQEVADGGISTVNSGAAAALTYDGMVDLSVALPAQYRGGAVYLMNSQTFGELLKLKDTTDRPLINVNTVPLNLWNRPVIFSEYMPDVAAGANPIIFGDLNYYGIADREDMMLIRLGELYAPAVGLLPVARVGGQVLRTPGFRAMTVSA